MKGRTPPPALPSPGPRPAAWGPWEWRNHLVAHSEAHTQGMPGWMAKWACSLKKACLNNVYSVQFFDHETDWGVVEHLMIRPHDQQPVHRWSDLQRIKDELCGVERVAVEVYPRAADLCDDCNIYHLWVLPEGFELPFGLHRWEWKDGKP